jgi:hypothetical protein
MQVMRAKPSLDLKWFSPRQKESHTHEMPHNQIGARFLVARQRRIAMKRYLQCGAFLLLLARTENGQKATPPDEYDCIDPSFIRTSKGEVISVPCRIASVKGDTLSATDRAVIDMMRSQDFEFNFRTQTKGTDSATFDSLRSAYNKNAHALCQSHPKMVFAEIGDDEKLIFLHSCANLR